MLPRPSKISPEDWWRLTRSTGAQHIASVNECHRATGSRSKLVQAEQLLLKQSGLMANFNLMNILLHSNVKSNRINLMHSFSQTK
ncbi:unnamed protein product [Protopolystoma xenopodis]|uniref:Uncharacterized protein n=1 Tax=Protopolystoma xenopodis TaxID=117903 RepID=A0A448X473_9PLAT|nr:unnamed protein product [Protopolystoma xenopodis]